MLSDNYFMHRTCPYVLLYGSNLGHPLQGIPAKAEPGVSKMTRTFDWADIFSHLKMHMKADMCSKFLSIVSDHTVGFCGRGKAKTAI